ELLSKEATQGLSPTEANELDALLAQFPDEDPDGLERAAAAVHRALSPPPEELPAALAERLHLAAAAFESAAPAATRRPPRQRPLWLMLSGWAVAASVLIVAVWLLSLKPREVIVEKEKRVEVPVEVVKVVEVLKPEPTPDKVRDEVRKDPTAKTL